MMQALVDLGTENTAKALASGLGDFFVGDDSVQYLIQMGSIAEKPVLAFTKDKDAKTRSRAYAVLYSIGTEESLNELSNNVRLERDGNMRRQVMDCREEIRKRIKELKKEKEQEQEAEDKS